MICCKGIGRVFSRCQRGCDPYFWVNPLERGIFPLGEFHISRSLRRRILKVEYDVWISSAFADVVTDKNCRKHGESNNLSYCHFAERRKAHSAEIWRGNRLTGGVYGVVEGGFFGWHKLQKQIAPSSALTLIIA